MIKIEDRKQSSEQKARQIAVNSLSEEMIIEAIARITSLSLQVLQQLHNQQIKQTI